MTIPPVLSPETEVSLTREELHEQVWAEPMWTLAARFGLSDVGLAKTCRRHQVPVPPRGYWRQKEVGQGVRPTKLSKLSATLLDRLGTITFRRRVSATSTSDPEVKTETPTIVVTDILTDPHPLVAHSIRALRRVKPAKNGMLSIGDSADCLDVRVSVGTVDRTMRILDALIRACEDRGYTISLDVAEKTTRTKVLVDGMSLSFHMDEMIETVVIPPEERKPPRPGFWSPVQDHKEVPSGELSFNIEGNWYWYKGNIRRTWRDGKKQRLEGCIGSILVGLQQAAFAMKTSRAAEEERDRHFKEEERKRKHAAWVEHGDKQQREYIENDLKTLRTISELREYVAFRRARVENPSEVLEEWLAWVTAYADRLEQRVLKYAGPKIEPFNENSYYY